MIWPGTTQALCQSDTTTICPLRQQLQPHSTGRETETDGLRGPELQDAGWSWAFLGAVCAEGEPRLGAALRDRATWGRDRLWDRCAPGSTGRSSHQMGLSDSRQKS